MTTTKWRIVLGSLAVLFYAAHTAYHAHNHEAFNMLWACHLGCLLVGLGLLLARPLLFSTGFMWLTLGVPLWIFTLLGGEEFIVTSALTHAGGLTVALAGFRYLPIARGAWISGVSGLFLVAVLSRFTTPAAANVNLAHRVYDGWEQTFPSHTLYAAMFLAIAAVEFFVMERAVRWVLVRRKRHDG